MFPCQKPVKEMDGLNITEHFCVLGHFLPVIECKMDELKENNLYQAGTWTIC